MGQIKVEKNVGGIEGLCIIEPTVHGDNRGYFMETYNSKDMQEAGIDRVFVQDNQSCSTKGVLRGLHFQKKYPQAKLVRAVKGSVFDVAVDLRSDSKTYGKWYGVELTEENKKQFLIPEGFAHGFLVLTDVAEFCYKVTDFWHLGDESGLAWWFLDSRDGMEAQMKALGNNGLLGNFVGMLTDSRSFLSYTRHDYFRRIACCPCRCLHVYKTA